MAVLPLNQANSSALIELVVTILAFTLTFFFSLICFHSKLHAAKSGKSVKLSPNDFTSGLGHLNVLLMDRHISVRGIVGVILAIALTVTSSTALLGTTTVRCAPYGNGYAGKTAERNTTCSRENRKPGSANPLVILGRRLRQLVAEETRVDVDVHPSHFDVNQDAVTEFRTVLEEDEVLGEVLKEETCSHKPVFEIKNNVFSIRTNSVELNALKSNETITASPNSSSGAGFLGMTHDFGSRELVAVWAKEVTIGTETHLYVVYGYAAEDFRGVIEDSRCVKLTYSVPGLQVLEVPGAVLGLGDYNADPIRLVKVAWLTASLSQVLVRQQTCTRRNYTIKECTKLSWNTVITIAALAGACATVFLWVMIIEVRIGRCELRSVFNPYGLFALAARSVNGRTEWAKGVSNQSELVYEAKKDGGGWLEWVDAAVQ